MKRKHQVKVLIGEKAEWQFRAYKNNWSVDKVIGFIAAALPNVKRVYIYSVELTRVYCLIDGVNSRVTHRGNIEQLTR